MAKWGSFKWGEEKWVEGVTIAGNLTDVAYVNISDLLTKEINTCTFEIYGTYANKPLAGQEVIIKKGGVKLFHGRITAIEAEKLAGNEFVFFVECSDWQIDLDKKLVIETFEGQTLYYIVDFINTKYCAGFTVNNVANPGATINRIQFNYALVSECFEQLADQTGLDWYVDYDKDIHFFVFDENAAPIALEDNGTEFYDLIITPDYTQIVNKIWAQGGFYKSSEYTQNTITAAAGQKDFDIKYKPHDISVTVDAAPKTIGIQFVDDEDGTFDFLVNYNEKNLKADSTSYPTGLTGGEAVIMKYKYEIPILAVVEDIGSQSDLKDVQGGDGIREKYIVDQNIETLDQARERGLAELDMYSEPLIEGSFSSLQDGWKSGQRLHVDLTDRDIDAYYMIREVNIEAIGGDQYIYHITFATYLQGFNWLLIKLIDGLTPKVTRSDVIIDQIIPIAETITPSDGVPSTTLITPPYQYGAGGVPQGVYNESEYA